MTALARYTLRAHAVAGLRPSYQLARLNDALLRQHAPGFVTVALARLELTEPGARVELATPGTRCRSCRATARPPRSAAVGTPLGISSRPDCPRSTIELGAGDALPFYTDGVTERRRHAELFGEARLVALAQEHAGRSAEELVGAIEDAGAAFAPGLPQDDVALLAVRVVGAAMPVARSRAPARERSA